jgi:hypothetical protein
MNEPAVLVRRAGGLLWFSEIGLLLGSIAALGLATAMFLSDDLGEAMLDKSEASLGRLLATIPAPGPAILCLAIGIYGLAKFYSGIGLLFGVKPIIFVNQGVQGVSIGAQAVGGREKAVEVARGGSVVLTARRVTRFRGGFVRLSVIRVTTEGGYLEVDTTIPANRLDPSPLARILPMYSIRFQDRIQR